MAKIEVEGTVVELDGGTMTQDLALLVGPDQAFPTTAGSLEALNQNLAKELG